MHNLRSYHFDSENDRLLIVRGYDELVQRYIDEGRKAYFVTIIFRHIVGSRSTKIEVMNRETRRFFRKLTTQIVRKPNSANWTHLKPIAIGCIDLPVHKRSKSQLRDVTINDGLHIHLVVLLPPRYRKRNQSQRQSRLRVGLKTHLKEQAKNYLSEFIYRIHAVRIQEGTMADYCLKAFKSGRLSSDQILVL